MNELKTMSIVVRGLEIINDKKNLELLLKTKRPYQTISNGVFIKIVI